MSFLSGPRTHPDAALRERADLPLVLYLLKVDWNGRQSWGELQIGLDRRVVKTLRVDNTEPDEGLRIVEEFCKGPGALDVRFIIARPLWRECLQKIRQVVVLERPEERLESIFRRVVSDQASLRLANVVGRQGGGISATG